MAIMGRDNWRSPGAPKSEDFEQYLARKFPERKPTKSPRLENETHDKSLEDISQIIQRNPDLAGKVARMIAEQQAGDENSQLPKDIRPGNLAGPMEDDIVGKIAAEKAAKQMAVQKRDKAAGLGVSFTPRTNREAPGGRGEGGMIYPTRPEEIFQGATGPEERPQFREKAFDNLIDELKGTIGQEDLHKRLASKREADENARSEEARRIAEQKWNLNVHRDERNNFEEELPKEDVIPVKPSIGAISGRAARMQQSSDVQEDPVAKILKSLQGKQLLEFGLRNPEVTTSHVKDLNKSDAPGDTEPAFGTFPKHQRSLNPDFVPEGLKYGEENRHENEQELEPELTPDFNNPGDAARPAKTIKSGGSLRMDGPSGEAPLDRRVLGKPSSKPNPTDSYTIKRTKPSDEFVRGTFPESSKSKMSERLNKTLLKLKVRKYGGEKKDSFKERLTKPVTARDIGGKPSMGDTGPTKPKKNPVKLRADQPDRSSPEYREYIRGDDSYEKSTAEPVPKGKRKAY